MSSPDPMPLGKRAESGAGNPEVSVLIATYNHAPFVRHCLDGVLSQLTSFPVEIIVHDDASTDGTADIVRAYGVRYPGLVRTVLQSENQYSKGQKVWPLLHRLAKGRFIAYCDGDDFWLNPRKLAIQVAFLSTNPEFVLSFHDAVEVGQRGELMKADHLEAAGKRDYSSGELRVLRWGWILFGTMVHRNVNIEFPPEYYLAPNGDNFMPMLLAEHGGAKFQEAAGPLAYRHHSGGVWSMRPSLEQKEMHLRTYLQIVSYYARIGEHSSARFLIQGRLHHHVMSYLQALDDNSRGQ